MVDLQSFNDMLIEKVMLYVPKLVVAVLTLFIGLFIIRILTGAMSKQMKNQKVDLTLRLFIASIVGVALKVMLAITVISMFGVQMTSFIAVLAAAGLAVGLALQGSLANFAGGVLIMLFKPFKAGDVIEAQGFLGKVDQIQIFHTIMKTPDNKTVILPNGALSNGNLVNFSTEAERRVDLVFGIGYGDSIPKARKVIAAVIKENKKILKDPEPKIVVKELGDSSVNFAVRVWTKAADYWDVFFYLQENVKINFDKNRISIPFPQRDVHVYKQ